MDFWELCKCNSTQICPFCKGLVVVGIAILCGVAGYFVVKGLRKKDKG